MSLLNQLSPRAKSFFRNVGRSFGLDIRINGVNARDDLRLIDLLHAHRISTVLDVGANNGGFARALRAAGFRGRIISFEPLPQAYGQLQASAAKDRHGWEVAPRMALDNKQGTNKFYVTQASTSSSLLEPTIEFAADTPQARLQKVVEVPTQRLDVIADKLSIQAADTLLKLDVQGGEERVLEGATGLLGSLGGVLSEMSLMTLYEEQSDFSRLHDLLMRRGFELWDIWPGYRNPQSNRLLQFDGLYFRSPNDKSAEARN